MDKLILAWLIILSILMLAYIVIQSITIKKKSPSNLPMPMNISPDMTSHYLNILTEMVKTYTTNILESYIGDNMALSGENRDIPNEEISKLHEEIQIAILESLGENMKNYLVIAVGEKYIVDRIRFASLNFLIDEIKKN